MELTINDITKDLDKRYHHHGSSPTLIGGCAYIPIINNGNIATNIPATNSITKNISLAFVTIAFTLFNIRQY